jgi:hypothetical protein
MFHMHRLTPTSLVGVYQRPGLYCSQAAFASVDSMRHLSRFVGWPLAILRTSRACRSTRVCDHLQRINADGELDLASAGDLARSRFKVFGSVVHHVIDAGAEERPYCGGRSLSVGDVPGRIGHPVAEVP